jgi:hypothetical protein
MKTKYLIFLILTLWIAACHKDKDNTNTSNQNTTPVPDYRLKFVGHYYFKKYDYGVDMPGHSYSDSLFYHSKIAINPATNNSIFIYNSDTISYLEVKIDTAGVMPTISSSVSATFNESGGHFNGTDSVYYYNYSTDGHYNLSSNTDTYGKRTSK